VGDTSTGTKTPTEPTRPKIHLGVGATLPTASVGCVNEGSEKEKKRYSR
jgi:hypothetical protein